MHAISVKELRQKFPFVRSELAKGESFLIIHKSKPIAQLKPMNNGNGNRNSNIAISDEAKEDTFAEWQAAGAEEWSKLPPITKEEYDYYMSLPPIKD